MKTKFRTTKIHPLITQTNPNYTKITKNLIISISIINTYLLKSTKQLVYSFNLIYYFKRSLLTSKL
jgi:hypothetical protein